MTRLELRLHHPYISEPLPLGAVAKVRWVGQADGKPPPRWWTAEKALGAGNTEVTKFDLPDGGYYLVEVVRPRGTPISGEYLVERNQTRREDIDLGASPHEYLSWSQLAGIVPRKLDLQVTARDLSSRFETPGEPPLQSAMHAERNEPLLAGARIPSSGNAWPFLAPIISGESPRELLGFLESAAYPGPSCQMVDDGHFVTWWFPLDNPTRELVEQWTKGEIFAAAEDFVPPKWIFVEIEGSLDLLSLPWAWWLAPSSIVAGTPPIQVLHDRMGSRRSDREGRGRTTVSVRDDRWFPLLEFMASGRLTDAASIADAVITDEELINALALKKKGPLLAAAAAVILSARTTSTDWQQWDQWLENLANWFPRIPDGKIILGCRRLQQAQSYQDRAKVLVHLQEGFARGIPMMSATFRMFALALAQLGDDFPEAEQLRLDTAAVAARVDPEQPFTVIRL
jgi:hypothetical protein